ncbi:MAG: polysaccharide deacetylase family protein [Candidatus Sumerlaeota bacterium]|nr:polysaccharide deacetylase family protein [Candidatus Sumerlaeota bacterium]
MWPQQYPAAATPTPKPRFQWFRRAPAGGGAKPAAARSSNENQSAKSTSAVAGVRPAKTVASKSATQNKTTAKSQTAVKSSRMKAGAGVTTGPRPISNWPTGKKLLALTYDDGPNSAITPKLVRLLRQKNAHATFFLLGESIRAYPSAAGELARAGSGFELGNHGVTHKQFTKLGEDGIRREMDGCNDLITSISSERTRVIRPPYGSWNTRVRDICETMGLKIILWDVDTNDWRRRTTDQIVNTVLKEARDGSIILMHDRFQTSLEATGRIIDVLGGQGYRFVTVSELIAAGN